jgi:hypothetical protein
VRGLAGEIHGGMMVGPQFAVELDLSTVIAGLDGGGDVASNIGVLAVRWWPIRMLWLKGGVGFGDVQFTDYTGVAYDSETGLGFLGAVGLELLASPSFALDVQLRISVTSASSYTSTNAGLMLGINFY